MISLTVNGCGLAERAGYLFVKFFDRFLLVFPLFSPFFENSKDKVYGTEWKALEIVSKTGEQSRVLDGRIHQDAPKDIPHI